MTSSNIMVAESGTSIRLCRLPLGDELSSFSNGRDVALFHARRESDLVHAFGTIISELLHGPKGIAGHAPPTMMHDDEEKLTSWLSDQIKNAHDFTQGDEQESEDELPEEDGEGPEEEFF